jgi:GDP-L-fucose synthase
MKLNKAKIFLAGHKGLVGSAVYKLFKKNGFTNVIIISKKELDLTNSTNVINFLKKKKPSHVVICAAKVGGIKENFQKPAEFFYENSMIQNNIIHGSYLSGVKKLIFLGSSCIYPKFSNQPIDEKELLNGKLEITNQAYAISKISGVEMCRSYNIQYGTNYKCLMPTNLYGPNDNYDLNASHFFAAAIRKIYDAKIKNKKSVKFWGTGNSKREAMFVDDLAEAILFFLDKNTNDYLINVGTGYEQKIKNFIKIISKIIDYKGKILFDQNKALDGTPRKVVKISLAKKHGWKSMYSFEDGLKITLNDFIKNYKFYVK